MNPGGLGDVAGFVLLFFGMVHFVARDHEQDGRSYFLGGIRLGHAARLVFAALEMLVGAALLLT